MKSYFILKNAKHLVKEYIFIFLTAILFTFIPLTKSFGEQNVFTINNVKVKGVIDLNFSRDKYLNKAFFNAFEILKQKILLTRDLEKVKNVDLKQIKNLIKSFQISEESFSKEEYKANLNIFFNEKKIKIFLGKKNISFSRPENISAVFFPILYIDGEIQDFNENFFYKNWLDIEIENEMINFVLPLEDLDDISKISEAKDRIEDLNVEILVNKYDINNYVFTLMDYQDKKLNVYLKVNFNNNIISKNISYEINDIKDELILKNILKNLKLRLKDLWKEENLVNVLMPLSINIKFQHLNIKDLDLLMSIFHKISIIDDYTLEEFNINNSFFKIYYYGSPKKLRSELLKFGYSLNNDQGFWQLYLNE